MIGLFLIARLDAQRVAIAASAVDSVVKLAEITAVPLAPRQVLGIAALRSRVITVIDTRAALELEARERPAALTTIVVNLDGHQYGLVVDAVEDVRALPGTPSAPRTPLGPGWARATLGMLDDAGGALLLLDSAALVASPLRAVA